MEELTVEAARNLLMDADVSPLPTPASGDASSDGQGGATAEETPQNEGLAQEGEPPSRVIDDGSVGLGIDIVEIDRMRRILARTPAFAERVFSEEERAYCDSMSNPATHYALRFAAKEAVSKALGTGFSEGIGVRDIEVQRAKNGRPSARLSGRALEIAEEQGVRELSISLSYTHTDAVACAMAVTDSAVRASEKRKDPMEELAKQFKEVRGMLDEL